MHALWLADTPAFLFYLWERHLAAISFLKASMAALCGCLFRADTDFGEEFEGLTG
jgi:hypothetical protein